MSIIEEFMKSYRSEFATYEELAKLCSGHCESGLKRSGIRALVTYRAKRSDRLYEKVVKRSSNRTYQTITDVYEDIVDLAGVRIALFFPGDRREIDALIRDLFQVSGCKDFPKGQNISAYPKRFAGYAARHYRVTLLPETLRDDQIHLTALPIEIQVGSILMHAWAEIEHDLVYKPQTGSLSLDEYAILDEINGLVHTGEIALERLQEAANRRITHDLEVFSSHYELSAYLYSRVKACLGGSREFVLGRADILFRFLQFIGRAAPQNVEPYLAQIDLESVDTPVIPKIINCMLEGNPEHYRAYDRARIVIAQTDPYAKDVDLCSLLEPKTPAGRFFQGWIELERELFDHPQDFVSADLQRELTSLRELRDRCLYGARFPSSGVLEDGARRARGAHSRLIGKRSPSGEEAMPRRY